MKQSLIDQIRGNDPLVERPKNVLQGTIAGFPVHIRYDSTNIWWIVIDARAGAEMAAYPMDQFLMELRGTNKKITKASYDGKRFEVLLRGSGKAGEQVREILDRSSNYLVQNRYVPCCGYCGQEVPVTLCSINGAMDFLCDSCYTQICNDLETNKQEKAAERGNIVTGIVGALLGALIGGVLWVVIFQLGYIAGIAGLVTAVCALKGYEKFGGKINVAGIVITLAIVAAVIYFAQNLGLALEIYREFKDYGITFAEAYRSIPEFMDFPEISRAFWGDLAVGYLLTAVASFATVRAMFVKSAGSYKTERYE